MQKKSPGNRKRRENGKKSGISVNEQIDKSNERVKKLEKSNLTTIG